MGELADTTLSARVPCPDAIVASEGTLGRHEWDLAANSDVAHWVGSVLTLYKGPPEKLSGPAFWREAVKRRSSRDTTEQ
jgi:hypothetical protein